MSTTEMIREFKSLSPSKREKALQSVLTALYPQSKKVIKRIWRRIENPEVPEDVWEGLENAEDGLFVDMEKALYCKPPWQK